MRSAIFPLTILSLVYGSAAAQDVPAALSGTNLFGMGVRPAQILYDTYDPNTPTVIQSGTPGGARTQRAGEQRVGGTQKGSVLVWPKVELKWDASGNLLQDTFLALSNDWNADVDVIVFLVLETCTHFGNTITLTKNEATYWSAMTGGPKGLTPFTALGERYPDPDQTGDYVLRGYVLAWAVGPGNFQVSWNHLWGTATVVDYGIGEAWEYNAYGFQDVSDAEPGTLIGTPGVINLDGVEFDAGFSMLALDFFASGANAFSSSDMAVLHDTDLTLVVLDNDLRQEAPGPVTTKAQFNIWNQNEVGLSGLHYCVTKWDESLFSLVGGHFLVQNLQTDKGRARITGVHSAHCDDGDIVSEDASLLGVAARLLRFVPAS